MHAWLERWGIPRAPVTDERWKLVERIIASSAFHKAPQLRDILVYVAARSLTESPVTISEQEIGSIALNRGPDFDPGHDNIVRAQMRHLRLKLDDYFAGDGRAEPLVLTIPKGHYVARFDERSNRAATSEVNGDKDGVLGSRSSVTAAPGKSRKLAGAAVATAALVLVFIAGWRLAPRSPLPAPEAYSMYDDVLGPATGVDAAGTQLVLGNPVVLLYAGTPSKDAREIGTASAIPVPAELKKYFVSATNRADRMMPYHVLQIKNNDYTGLGDATGCFYLGGLMRTLGRGMLVTQARFLNWDSARRRNLVILGSPDINDWADANVPRHNYNIVNMGIENRNPQDGEPSIYPEKWDETGNPIEDHGLIWSWKTPAESRVLVLAGPSSAATGAMARLFADPEQFRPVYEGLRADAPGNEFPSNWQVLFKVDIRDNLPVKTTYITHRIYQPVS